MVGKNIVLRSIILAAIATILMACSAGVNGVPEPRYPYNSAVQSGRSVLASYCCGSCHTIPWVSGADGKAAPPLSHFYERSYIAGELANTEDNLSKWIQDPHQVEPGTAMPPLGVSADEAKTIIAYLYHKRTISDLIKR